jgi:hypothetical protein
MRTMKDVWAKTYDRRTSITVPKARWNAYAGPWGSRSPAKQAQAIRVERTQQLPAMKRIDIAISAVLRKFQPAGTRCRPQNLAVDAVYTAWMMCFF